MTSAAENLLIDGQAGKLELLIETPADSTLPEVAVICHPHPQYGGTLHNKVVYSVARALLGLGKTVVRFNFRGVGKSGGGFADGVGEVEDLAVVLAWAEQELGGKPTWLGGFSFGSAVAATMAERFQPAFLLLVAPPVNMPFFPQRLSVGAATRVGVIHGGQDSLIGINAVMSWIGKQEPKIRLYTVPQADHFYHGELDQLRSAVRSFADDL